MEELTWLEAIKKVLGESPGIPMHYSDITNKILSSGYYKTNSATPANSVNSQITSSIRIDGEKSPFVRTKEGTFILKQTTQADQSVNPIASETIESIEEQESELIIRSFGMYWQRNLVSWHKDPHLFGKQPYATTQVDFMKQIGIYTLYDYHSPIYIGRTTEKRLGQRLFEHTKDKDRIGNRWNRFSWFGLLDVKEDGNLCENFPIMSLSNIIGAFEALLIEVLEPSANRKGGDNLKGLEYNQGSDSALNEQEIKKKVLDYEKQLRGGF
jgi:hypothetical protein